MTHNPIRPWRNIERRRSRRIMVGPVPVGGDAPISVQTMTNTLTTDVAGTVAQVQAAAEAGADIVRVSVPDEASSKALREIVRESPVPIVADIHFHYKRGIEAAEARALPGVHAVLTLADLRAQPWVHRVEGFTITPKGREGEIFELKADYATIFAPELVEGDRDAPALASPAEAARCPAWIASMAYRGDQ